MVYLHGFGFDVAKYAAYPTSFFQGRHTPYPGLKVICLEAPNLPMTVYNGKKMRGWYDYLTDHEGRAEDALGPESLAATVRRVHQVISAEAAAIGDSRRVLLGGISMGAGTALHCVATFEGGPVGGFCGNLGHVLDCTPVERLASACAGPLVFNNSREDELMQWSWVSATLARLDKVPNVSLNLETGTHEISYAKEGAYLTSFFARSCTPAPASVQLASLSKQIEARKRTKSAKVSRKSRRLSNDTYEACEDEDEDDDADAEFRESIKQSLVNDTTHQYNTRAKLRRIVDMGFEKEKVRDTLAACEWDSGAALTTLFSA
jgi:phospholipase/carboxylesterase